MKILIDTNVLFSAMYRQNSIPYRAFVKAVSAPNQAVICEQTVVELRRAFNRKYPEKVPLLESFLALTIFSLKVVPVAERSIPSETAIRDLKDRPIYRAAIHEGVDIILTGDKDFLESGIRHPKAMTPGSFYFYNHFFSVAFILLRTTSVIPAPRTRMMPIT